MKIEIFWNVMPFLSGKRLPVYRSACLQDPTTNKDGCESLSTASINGAMHSQTSRAILICDVMPDGEKTE